MEIYAARAFPLINPVVPSQVVINGLYSTENNQVINFDRPVKAVAMDPMFYKSGSGKHFVTGDDKVRTACVVVRTPSRKLFWLF